MGVMTMKMISSTSITSTIGRDVDVGDYRRRFFLLHNMLLSVLEPARDVGASAPRRRPTRPPFQLAADAFTDYYLPALAFCDRFRK